MYVLFDKRKQLFQNGLYSKTNVLLLGWGRERGEGGRRRGKLFRVRVGFHEGKLKLMRLLSLKQYTFILDNKYLSWVYGGDRKSVTRDHCSASRGLPSDTEQ